jgi:alpha-galactosidase
MIALYKEIRPTVQNGRLYRLQSPVDSDFSAVQYVSQDGRQVALFAFLHSQRFGRPTPPVLLQGLTSDATYDVRPTDDAPKGLTSVSGADLTHRGVELNLRGDYDSTLVIFDRKR